jgi:regulator of protease activity HflC (stomatin/prohibitin superfamily)
MAFGVRYLKAGPTTYVIQYVNGKARRAGPGLSFFYWQAGSVIVLVPISSVDVPFVFNEISADFQNVTIQGQLTYRVTDAQRLAQLLDFSINHLGHYISEDPKKLGERLVAQTQVLASTITHRMGLRDVLASYDVLSTEVLKGLKESPSVQMLGVEIMDLAINSLKPSPETGKALEAGVREGFLRQADEAVYSRRNAAVEQERKIKESELNTELAIQEKNRQIREAKMASDIAAEEQRASLLDQRVENDRKDADAKAYGLNAMLTPIKEVDWRTLTAISAGKLDPKLTIAMAFRDLAENASKIGELNISPETLNALLRVDGDGKR